MAKRQSEWARRTRDFLLDLLGGKCVRCGSKCKLQFDIIVRALAPDYARHHRQMNWHARMSFYKRALRLNNLQILCLKCNSKKKHHQDQEYYEQQQPDDNEPF